MNAAIKMPLRSLKPELVQDLQEKYPEAEVSVMIHSDRNMAPLSERYFWEIISMFDWCKGDDDDAVVAPAVAHLAVGPVRHILEFEDVLSEKLYTLDSRTYAMHIGEDAWSPDRYFSVDNFLYARCCAIANGEAFYQQVLNDPAFMPKDLTFETLLSVASEAYERKMGKPIQYVPTFPIETYSNEAGWQ